LSRALALLLAAALIIPLAACSAQEEDSDRPVGARAFPRPDRPVSPLSTNATQSEAVRDGVGEAEAIIEMAKVEPGMTIADIGAGEGYYTARLSAVVGPNGRVVAQDIDPDALRQLAVRIERQRLDNVSILTGEADNPRLPANSFDRIFLVHMYHEVSEPYAFLWRLRPALRKGGRVIVVERNRPTDQHGISPALLFCEMQAAGFDLGAFVTKPELGGYYARFDPAKRRPEPSEIRPCPANPEVAAASDKDNAS
jgi:ubiquinone/menaquinone biosynthesis C-methylase UbiE